MGTEGTEFSVLLLMVTVGIAAWDSSKNSDLVDLVPFLKHATRVFHFRSQVFLLQER